MSAPFCLAWPIVRGFHKRVRLGIGWVRPLFTLQVPAAVLAVRPPRNHPVFTLPGYAARMNIRHCLGVLLAVVFTLGAGLVQAQDAPGDAPAGPSLSEIVDQLQQHNQVRTAELKQYKALRHYQVEYRGFSARVAARMDVEVNYNAATGKSFRIVSQGGSPMLCDKVLKRAIESEKEAFHDRGSTALTEANYRFRLVRIENVADRPAYVLDVEPIVASKFLIRGRIWVDAQEFAVVKMETEPAKSPSFWIARTLIHYTSVKTDGFWLPQQMRSETKVRIGGMAVMTIDFGSYDVATDTALR